MKMYRKKKGGITNMKKMNFKGVSMQTWARTIVLVLALISQLLVVVGRCTKAIDVDQWQEYVTYALTLISSLWAWWKNNSFTEPAQTADKVLKGDEKIE